MKKYLAFYGAVYYPGKGMDDFIGDFDTFEEAVKSIEEKNIKEDKGEWKYYWGIVWDTEQRIEVLCK